MIGSVGSFGSPLPKSITATPSAESRRRASSSRTNGYVAMPARVGEIRTAIRSDRIEQERPQRLEAPLEVLDRHLLVPLVRVRRGAGAEVDGVDALLGELGHRRPRLLRRDLEAPELDEPARARARGSRSRPSTAGRNARSRRGR